mmetsp:Transcript_71214/g.185664  ORF Transcript_71214/g.185664 Transcript_71214/m.185664 type:complete len:305 (+) Transcript_71214:48-962(+)
MPGKSKFKPCTEGPPIRQPVKYPQPASLLAWVAPPAGAIHLTRLNRGRIPVSFGLSVVPFQLAVVALHFCLVDLRQLAAILLVSGDQLVQCQEAGGEASQVSALHCGRHQRGRGQKGELRDAGECHQPRSPEASGQGHRYNSAEDASLPQRASAPIPDPDAHVLRPADGAVVPEEGSVHDILWLLEPRPAHQRRTAHLVDTSEGPKEVLEDTAWKASDRLAHVPGREARQGEQHRAGEEPELHGEQHDLVGDAVPLEHGGVVGTLVRFLIRVRAVGERPLLLSHHAPEHLPRRGPLLRHPRAAL